MRLVDFKKALNDTNEAELTVTGRTSNRETSRPVWFVHARAGGFSQTSDGRVREPLARSTQTRRAA